MIKYTTSIENNLFYVRFNLSPKDVTCHRSNYTATHKGAGSSRQGIKEGVELHRVYGRVNASNPWVDLGTNATPALHTHQNGDTIQLKAVYRIKTMGYHWQCTNGSLPFFYYGNIGGNANRYVHGYFTDGSPAAPSNSLHSIHAMVPVDWKHIATQWSDWAYTHGKNSENWAIDKGRYEQRNANVESATSSNGWISDSGYKQAWRKSCMFIFEKEFTVDVKSSGIVKDASVPEISVQAVKGDSGRVTVKYIDKYNSNGRLWLRAYCNDKQAEILTYDNSPIFANGNTKEFNINFVETFGENYRGNDIQYEAWAKNSHDKQSAGTGKKGGHRFNGRPSIPNGLFVKGHNKNVIYDDITFSWNASTDPEKDSLTYDLHLTTISAGGTKVRDSIIATKVNGLSHNYNIINDNDNCSYTLKVRAHDGLISSDWSSPLEFTKGAKPTGAISLVSPEVDNTNLYCTRPRFVFKGYDKKSNFIVIFNSKEYSSKTNPEYFTIENDKVMFCVNNTSPTIRISAYMKNDYGQSDKSAEYSFKFVDAASSITEGEYSQVVAVNELIGYVKDKAKAYNISTSVDGLTARETVIKATYYNALVKSLKAINNKINNIINTSNFDTQMKSEEIKPGVLNDDLLWNKLIEDIRNI